MNKRHGLAALLAGAIVLSGAAVAQAQLADPPGGQRSGGTVPAAPAQGHMGLSAEAWQEYRAGERPDH